MGWEYCRVPPAAGKTSTNRDIACAPPVASWVCHGSMVPPTGHKGHHHHRVHHASGAHQPLGVSMGCRVYVVYEVGVGLVAWTCAYITYTNLSRRRVLRTLLSLPYFI